jgi:phage terminase large subunit-like protein
VGFEMNTFTRKVLDRVATDESFFGIIFTIDAEDRWDVEDSWKKANPNYGVSVMPDALAQEANRARQLPSQQSNFRTKHLCQWMSADTTWIDARKLEACADPKLSEEEFTGQQCTMGLDLASKLDLCAAVKVFTRTIDDATHYYAFGKYWLPSDTVESSNNASYKGWARSGFLTVTEGSVTDLDFIEEEIREAAKKFGVREIAYDTFQATMLANHLLAEGLAMVETGMTVKNMSPAMKLLEELVSNGRFHFNGDPVLAWCISNVVCHRDVKDNVYPRKQNDELKIDACVALLMALARTILQPLEEAASIYDRRGLLTL